MTFLAPQLLALGAALLVIPIAIHLWSRRPARTVTVGSTRLLAGARPSRARRLALTDLPLLALRLVIFALVAAAAAGLAWRGDSTGTFRLALVAATDDAVARADSLRAAGWTPHLLAPGLPPIDEGDTVAADPSLAPVWSLLDDAAQRFPQADSVLVAAPLRAGSFAGAAGPVPFAVSWLPLSVPARAAADTLRACLAASGTPQDVARLAAAFESIALAAGRPARLDPAPCGASAVQLSLAPSTTGSSGAIARDLRTGIWHIAPSATREARLIDDLSEVLQVRGRELDQLPVPVSMVQPRREAQSARAGATSWSRWLALAALLLFAIERLLAVRQSVPAGSSA